MITWDESNKSAIKVWYAISRMTEVMWGQSFVQLFAFNYKSTKKHFNINSYI